MKKNCIVILASTFPRWSNDSVPTFVYDHAINMKEYFDKVIVIAPHYPGSKTKEIVNGIEVNRFRYFFPSKGENIAYGNFKSNNGIRAKIKSVFYVLSQTLFTIKIVHKNKPELLNAHWIVPQGFVGLIIKMIYGTKIITSVHGGDIYTLNGKFMRKTKRLIMKKSDIVVVNSSFTRDACKELYDRHYSVIPPNVDVEAFTSIDLNKKRHINNSLNIVYAGRLSEEKGVIYLLKAVLLLKSDKRNIHVSVIGDGPERNSLEAWVEKHKLSQFVTFEGWKQRHEIVEIYSKADVFVGPSIMSRSGWVEAFGIVFAEASSAGLPIIATRMGGVVDIVSDNKNGFLVSQKDPSLIAEKLSVLYSSPDLRKSLGLRGRAFAVKNFSNKKVKAKFQLLLESVT